MYMCSNWFFKSTPPCYDYNQSCTKASLFTLLETLCMYALWYVDTIVTFLLSRHFSTVTGPKCLAMTSPFPVSYLSLPWGHSFSSVLVCQHNQWNVQSLASLLILDCWSCQSTMYVHGQTRVLKVPVLQLLFWSATAVSSISLSLPLTLSLLLSLKLSSEFYKISSTSQSVRTFSAIAMPPVSLLSQQLNKVHRMKTCRVNTSNYRTYVDNDTKWKAELFSAFLQKELTRDICVDFKPAAEMKSMQCPSRRWWKYFKLQNAV